MLLNIYIYKFKINCKKSTHKKALLKKKKKKNNNKNNNLLHAISMNGGFQALKGHTIALKYYKRGHVTLQKTLLLNHYCFINDSVNKTSLNDSFINWIQLSSKSH